jgi:hypothetical protein
VARPLLLARASGDYWYQLAHSDEVVGGGREGKDPADPVGAAMPGLAQAADGFQPPKDLFDPFALGLADGVAWVAGGAVVYGVCTLRDVRRDLMLAQHAHQFLLIIILIGA